MLFIVVEFHRTECFVDVFVCLWAARLFFSSKTLSTIYNVLTLALLCLCILLTEICFHFFSECLFKSFISSVIPYCLWNDFCHQKTCVFDLTGLILWKGLFIFISDNYLQQSFFIKRWKQKPNIMNNECIIAIKYVELEFYFFPCVLMIKTNHVKKTTLCIYSWFLLNRIQCDALKCDAISISLEQDISKEWWQKKQRSFQLKAQTWDVIACKLIESLDLSPVCFGNLSVVSTTVYQKQATQRIVTESECSTIFYTD